MRFISQDPIGFAGGGANLYGYAADSPTNLFDPSGLLVFFGGAGFSAIAPFSSGGGPVGSAGGFFDFTASSAGAFTTTGHGAGLLFGGDVFFGFVFGNSSNLGGPFTNLSVGDLGFVTLSVLFSRGEIQGLSIGFGPGLSALAVEQTNTSIFTLPEIFGSQPPIPSAPVDPGIVGNFVAVTSIRSTDAPSTPSIPSPSTTVPVPSGGPRPVGPGAPGDRNPRPDRRILMMRCKLRRSQARGRENAWRILAGEGATYCKDPKSALLSIASWPP
jgi:hypothetical protein